MAQKRGKGGYGSENYDPKTGKYIKEDGGVYHAGARTSVEDIIASLKAGEYDDPEQGLMFSEFFANDDDNELEEDEELWNNKNTIISYIQERLDKGWTEQQILNTNMPEITEQEYIDFAQECDQITSEIDKNGFYSGYMGAGRNCFEFNKALRWGFQKFYATYPEFVDHYALNQQAITERARKLDNLTNSWEFPEDKKVIRFIDTAPLLSWFSKYGIFEGMDVYKNEFNIEMLKEGYDKQELTKRLSTLVGFKVPPDGSFTSFSCVSDASHMANNLATNKRHILIRYNVRAGTKAWISKYARESEGLFNRTTGFFIQGASLENIGGQEVIVLEYGIQ